MMARLRATREDAGWRDLESEDSGGHLGAHVPCISAWQVRGGNNVVAGGLQGSGVAVAPAVPVPVPAPVPAPGPPRPAVTTTTRVTSSPQATVCWRLAASR